MLFILISPINRYNLFLQYKYNETPLYFFSVYEGPLIGLCEFVALTVTCCVDYDAGGAWRRHARFGRLHLRHQELQKQRGGNQEDQQGIGKYQVNKHTIHHLAYK